MSMRKKRLVNPTAAVRSASVTASEMALLARCLRRKAATCRLYLMTKAPYSPYDTALRVS